MRNSNAKQLVLMHSRRCILPSIISVWSGVIPMKQEEKNPVDRRSFLKVAATGGAALVASAAGATTAAAQQAVAAGSADAAEVAASGKPGSDFMMDVLKPLDFEY